MAVSAYKLPPIPGAVCRSSPYALSASASRPESPIPLPRGRCDRGSTARTTDSLYALLVRVTALAQRAATELLFEVGVSPFEQWLLEAIPPDGDACASELAAELEVPPSTVTRALRRLEQHGFVTLRKGIFADARVLRAQVTPAGATIRTSGRGFESDVDHILVGGLSPRALDVLLQALVHVHKSATRRDREPPPG